MYDARWYDRAWLAAAGDATLARPERNAALTALREHMRVKRPVVVDTSDERYALRADRLAKEFDLGVIVRGSGRGVSPG